jgi:hypothetical protein
MPHENPPEANTPELRPFIGKPGEAVPTIDSADLKALWNCYQEVGAQHPEGGVAIAGGVIEHICSPGADARAVSYRFAMLGVLAGMLEAAWPGGQPSDAAFKVAARMELKWLAVGVVQNGLPFDVERFLAEVRGESMYGGAIGERLS